MKSAKASTAPKKGGTSYPSFSSIPAGQNPSNWVEINGRYFYNDYDTTGNYLRSCFARN